MEDEINPPPTGKETNNEQLTDAPVEQPEIIHPQPETEYMEVHHHPNVEKKGLKEYILEGLMIFIAVSMGFFAENIREHLGDRRKEKEFIYSLKEDLVNDAFHLHTAIQKNNIKYQKLDSLYFLLRLVQENKPLNLNRLYYLNFNYAFGLNLYKPNDRTISQLKNTAGFALIKKQNCRDSITSYYSFNETIIQNNSTDYKSWITDLDLMSQKIFDYNQTKVFGFVGGADVYLNDSLNLKLINSDKQLLSEYGNKVRSVMMMVDINNMSQNSQLQSCKNLAAMLNKEYHLENE